MKKTIQIIAIAAFTVSIMATSCSKDETTTTILGVPSISLTDSFGTNTIDTTNFFVKPFMKFSASPSAGTTLDSAKLEIKVNGVPYTADEFMELDSTEKKGMENTIPVSAFTSKLPLNVGNTLTFIFSVKDSKKQVKSSTLVYTVIKDNGIVASTEIELGAQSNTTIPYKFLGLANNFTTYTAGISGTAKSNSGNIDFVYYYGPTDKNTFAAPSNLDGAKVVWNSEINMWPKQNRTKFKVSTLTIGEFDSIKNNTKKDDVFANIDFATGTTDKVTSIAVGNVYAFQTASGVKGLAKFTSISNDNTGSTKVVIICQN